jgi:hypothetical protein
MTLNDDFAAGLSGLFDPVTGLGEEITLAGETVYALVRYDMDVDDNGIRFEVVDLDVLRTEIDALPEYRAEAVVDENTWYFWKQVAADTISRRLRFRKAQRFNSR